MKRKAIIILTIAIILLGLVAWQPATPLSLGQQFVTQECQFQAPASQGTVSLDTAVPPCWLAHQLP